MVLYRIVSKRKNAVLTGSGASRSTVNRWNSKGVEVIYTSQTRELAIAEISGYVPVGLLDDPYLVVIELSEPDKYLRTLEEHRYPDDWEKIPPGIATKLLGDEFVQQEDAIGLKVRSRHSTSSSGNVLLNPRHPLFEKHVNIVELVQLKP